MAKFRSKDEIEKDMDLGNKDEDPYTEQGREKLVEDDEMTPLEEGFMEGAEDKGELAKCAHCGKPLDTDDKKNILEKRLKGEIVWFCSDECAEKGKSH